jgi:geranyl-CoA carboxylase alpha subunit
VRSDIPIRTLLIANRGEIARRVIRTARRLGIATVAVYSDADAGAPHVADADRALRLGPAPPTESYLSIERVLAAARESGADAVHPGYGFLAENAAFAEACAPGLVFVGPDAHAIGLMGNKRLAKERMERAGIACVPGWHGEAQDADSLREAARAVGFPLMIKAAAGGGGRGMRVVAEASDLAAALESARSEAEAGFGDGALILERLIEDARHVEVQVFADRHGGVVHLGARDCSVQRRHQKVIEEAPPPGLSAEIADGLCATTVRAAQAIGYVGAGTVEFLVAADGAFHFLEMNTRPFPRDEHPPPGRAPGDRAGHRPRPRRVAAQDRCRRGSSPRPGRDRP